MERTLRKSDQVQINVQKPAFSLKYIHTHTRARAHTHTQTQASIFSYFNKKEFKIKLENDALHNCQM